MQVSAGLPFNLSILTPPQHTTRNTDALAPLALLIALRQLQLQLQTQLQNP